MKEIVINDNNLTDDDIELVETRVKALIINSKNQILLAHNNYTYQLPGGHKHEGEDIGSCLVREVKEETGMNFKIFECPFLCISTYDSNYFGTGKKVLNKIYYYKVYSDQAPNLLETNYDELELQTDFHLLYVNAVDFDVFVNYNMDIGMLNKSIGREMKIAFEEYNKKFELI